MNKPLFVHFFADQPKLLPPKKAKSSDPWRGTQERLDRRHRSELFVFLVFGHFWADQPKQKKQKVQTHREGPRRGWTRDIGQNFFCGFWSLLGRPAKNQENKKTKSKKFRPMTHGEIPRRGWTGDIGLIFLVL